MECATLSFVEGRCDVEDSVNTRRGRDSLLVRCNKFRR